MRRIAVLYTFIIATQATKDTSWIQLEPTHKYVQDSGQRTSRDILNRQTSRLDIHPGLQEGPVPQQPGAGRTSDDYQSRITNGDTAARGQFPWHAHIVMDSSNICGGSLISSTWVLTAGHCVSKHASYTVNLGVTSLLESQEGVVTQVSRYWIMHSDYDDEFMRNDIAIISLPTPVTFTDLISPVRLPRYSQTSQTFSSVVATVTGFGRLSSDNETKSPTLQFAQVKIIANEECVQTFPLHLLDSNICSSGGDGRNPCIGDSGGSLVITEDDGLYTLIGIVSFGKKNCPAGTPTAFVRITSYLHWIQTYSGIAIEE